MKRLFFPSLFLLAILTALSGCKKSNNPDDPFSRAFFKQVSRTDTGFAWEPKKVVREEEVTSRFEKKLIFADDFEREAFGENYTVQGRGWEIVKGEVHAKGAHNRNLVLSRVPLPENVMITFTMQSTWKDVDVKFNIYGDGKIHDHGDGYTLILGGWHNRFSIISRLNEHERNRIEIFQGGMPMHRYHVTVVRYQNRIYWFLDGKLFLARWDDRPLLPKDGYKYFSFANWETSVYFDNLKIYSIKLK